MTTGQIYKSQMQAASRIFCFFMTKILATEPYPVVKPKRLKDAEETGDGIEIPDHDSANC